MFVMTTQHRFYRDHAAEDATAWQPWADDGCSSSIRSTRPVIVKHASSSESNRAVTLPQAVVNLQRSKESDVV